MQKRITWSPLLLTALMVLLFLGGLVYGAVSIPLESVIDILMGKDVGRPAWQNIILQSRFPQAVTALLAGASLATSGLLLQTLFRNPLAGPSILGISDGANLGVAAIMLYFGGTLSMVTELPISGYLAVIFAAFAGAACILGLIIWFSAKVKSNVMLLIIGIMIGYLASSLISVLNYYASTDKVHAFVMWGLGNFSGVSLMQLPYFLLFTVGHPADKTPQRPAAGGNVCRQPRNPDQTHPHPDPVLHRTAYRNDDCFLWPDLLHRTGRSAYRPPDVGLLEP